MNAVLIQSLTIDELKTIIVNVISDQLKEHFKKEEIPKQYISRKRAAEMLDCSLNTLDDWSSKGYFIPYKFGKSTIKYLKHEIEEAGPNIIRRKKSGGRHV